MYGIVLQIVRDCGADDGKRLITEVAYDAVDALLTAGLAEIGDSRLEGDRVEFYPWRGSLHEQKIRLKRVIDEFGPDPGLGEGFWLASPLHK